MTGNEADATLALTLHRVRDKSALFSNDGSTRLVYLIDGVLYKAEYDEAPNVAEMAFIEAKRSLLPAGVHFPDTSLYFIDGEPVIAAELIEGQLKADCNCVEGEPCDETCLTPDEIALLHPFLTDSGGMNVIHNDEGYWIIDAA